MRSLEIKSRRVTEKLFCKIGMCISQPVLYWISSQPHLINVNHINRVCVWVSVGASVHHFEYTRPFVMTFFGLDEN